LKRGEFRSLIDLQPAINRYIAEDDDRPGPFVWTKTAGAIRAKISRQPERSE
jgi:hypothetical protein